MKYAAHIYGMRRIFESAEGFLFGNTINTRLKPFSSNTFYFQAILGFFKGFCSSLNIFEDLRINLEVQDDYFSVY